MWTEKKLDEMLTTPSPALVEDMKKIKGDVIILGAGGKMGPTLALLAKRAAESAGVSKRIIAVSRFSDPSFPVNTSSALPAPSMRISAALYTSP